jgi:superfamily I DNA and RNA helicase
LTTKGRHPVHVERSDADKDAYWQDLWSTDDVFYSTVSGFKGLERPAVVIAVNGFHDEIDPKDVLYTALSRAMDLAVIVGERAQLEQVLGQKHLRRMERRQSPS